MNRYDSDSDDAYYTLRQQSDNNIRASGWQTPLPISDEINSSSSSVIHLVVQCPFDSKKCDYTIDKSQHGRLIITAHRRQCLSLKNKNNTIIQTFIIPYDADVDHLQSYIERPTNHLIIEIPRLHSSYINTKNTYIGSPKRKNEKLEYHIDCHGYTVDELDVFIQNRDLIVQGKTKRSTSSDPTQQQQHVSKQFSRKISLPNTVDLSKVISYFENGELRIEAPLKREIYNNNNNEQILSPKRTNRIQSPVSGHYRRRERKSHHHPSNTMQRVRSAESVRYPLYRSLQKIDDDGRHQRTVKYEHYSTNRHNSEQQPLYKSIYEPAPTRTTYRTYPIDNDVYYKYS